jgi:hypothetical protein
MLETLDTTMAYTGDETRDGGQTPGPFEEMRRRMADSGLETPATRKRKRKEKKRKWEWTLGAEAEAPDEEERSYVAAHAAGRTPLTAIKIEDTPITAIRRAVSVSTDGSELSDVEEGRYEGRYEPSVEPSEDSEMSESWDGSVTSVHSEPLIVISQSL